MTAAPVEFVTSGERLWDILGNPAQWPEFTITPRDEVSLVGGILVVNGANAQPRYMITDYMPTVGGYWLERLPEL